NGDGYSAEWVHEAARRGLPNLRTTPEAIEVFKNRERTGFLTQYSIFSERELETRYNVFLERYLKVADIEFKTMKNLIDQVVLPSCLSYKAELVSLIEKQKALSLNFSLEKALYERISEMGGELMRTWESFYGTYEKISALSDHA